MIYEQQQPSGDSNGLGGILICIVIFLILVMLFRGVRGRQECVIYMADADTQGEAAPPWLPITRRKRQKRPIQWRIGSPPPPPSSSTPPPPERAQQRNSARDGSRRIRKLA